MNLSVTLCKPLLMTSYELMARLSTQLTPTWMQIQMKILIIGHQDIFCSARVAIWETQIKWTIGINQDTLTYHSGESAHVNDRINDEWIPFSFILLFLEMSALIFISIFFWGHHSVVVQVWKEWKIQWISTHLYWGPNFSILMWLYHTITSAHRVRCLREACRVDTGMCNVLQFLDCKTC